MSSVFPIDLPGSTTFYITLFVATLVIHFIFMSYVLAGMVWVLAGLWVPSRSRTEIVDLLKDWMPVMLSGAITAGVAPLLFIQILYRQQFYTANLLQFHRWMVILPVLIVLFYLLYVVKAKFADGAKWLQRVSALTAAGCVLFIAWSWSGNHVLSLENPEIWYARYGNPSAINGTSRIVWLRLALWITTTFPVLSGWLSWQLRNHGTEETAPPGIARASAIALWGLVLSNVLAALLLTQLSEHVRRVLLSSSGMVWVIVAGMGAAIQAGGWFARFRSGVDGDSTRWVVSVGILLHLAGLMMCRELIRVTVLADRIDFAGHADAATAGGMTLFFVFCAVNSAAALWCIHLVRKSGGATDSTI